MDPTSNVLNKVFLCRNEGEGIIVPPLHVVISDIGNQLSILSLVRPQKEQYPKGLLSCNSHFCHRVLLVIVGDDKTCRGHISPNAVLLVSDLASVRLRCLDF